MASPYKNKGHEKWGQITKKIIKQHPLNEKDIVDVVLESWNQIFISKIGAFYIGKNIFPSPQIMSFLLHELVALNLSLKSPKLFRVSNSKNEKDVVCLNDDKYSIEIKGSSHPNQVFGNRSYAQPETIKTTKKKDGYFITINFEKFTKSNKVKPRILLVRFGYLEHIDWIAQFSATGQQARLTQNAYKYKLKTLYNVNAQVKKEK